MESLQGGDCSQKFVAKYAKRPSPPYPANECCNRVGVGNDGQLYESTRVGDQKACSWKKSSRASFLTLARKSPNTKKHRKSPRKKSPKKPRKSPKHHY